MQPWFSIKTSWITEYESLLPEFFNKQQINPPPKKSITNSGSGSVENWLMIVVVTQLYVWLTINTILKSCSICTVIIHICPFQ